MADLKLKNRHPVSDDVREDANATVEDQLGIRPLPDEGPMVEKAIAERHEVLLVDGRIHVVLEGPETDEPTPTLRALLETRPQRAEVTVDMGAVPHLRNGADVMSPGITDADPDIEEGDLVWVTDVEHGQPLGIGRALIAGPAMVEADSGKAIAIWHHVGDEIWEARG